MGIIRGGALAVISCLLLVVFFLSLLLLTMSWSLNYDNVKTELGGVIKGDLKEKLGLESFINENYLQMQAYCNEFSTYVLNYRGRIINIPCGAINQNVSLVFEEGVDSYIERVYYQEYDCEFWDCFSQETIPFFLVSAKAQDYWYKLFNYSLIIIAVLSTLGFLLAQKKSNFFILVSALLILASIPFAKIDWLISLTGKTAGGLLSVFFSKGYEVFLRGVIFGVVLLFIGLMLKLFKIGFKISTIFIRDKDKDEDKDKEEKKESKDDKKEKKKEDVVKKEGEKVVLKKKRKPKKKIVKKKIVKKKRK